MSNLEIDKDDSPLNEIILLNFYYYDVTKIKQKKIRTILNYIF